MMRLRSGLAALGAVWTFTASSAELPVNAESVGMSTERLQRIGTAMQRHIDAGKIQGAVTALSRRGKVVHFEAHGLMDVEAERPMDRDAIFIMMSSTKPAIYPSARRERAEPGGAPAMPSG